VPEIDGITFDDQSYYLVSQLIARLKQEGDFAVYGLPRMHAGQGEVRLAHQGRDTKRKIAKGVFCRFIPTAKGVTFTHRKEVGGSKIRTPITPETLDLVLSRIVSRRDFVRERLKGFEKVYPQPGMVSAGQFESNRSKH
jgi:hypothetical protein